MLAMVQVTPMVVVMIVAPDDGGLHADSMLRAWWRAARLMACLYWRLTRRGQSQLINRLPCTPAASTRASVIEPPIPRRTATSGHCQKAAIVWHTPTTMRTGSIKTCISGTTTDAIRSRRVTGPSGRSHLGSEPTRIFHGGHSFGTRRTTMRTGSVKTRISGKNTDAIRSRRVTGPCTPVASTRISGRTTDAVKSRRVKDFSRRPLVWHTPDYHAHRRRQDVHQWDDHRRHQEPPRHGTKRTTSPGIRTDKDFSRRPPAGTRRTTMHTGSVRTCISGMTTDAIRSHRGTGPSDP